MTMNPRLSQSGVFKPTKPPETKTTSLEIGIKILARYDSGGGEYVRETNMKRGHTRSHFDLVLRAFSEFIKIAKQYSKTPNVTIKVNGVWLGKAITKEFNDFESFQSYLHYVV